ncbi:hypothetical protein GGH93_002793 [Coemansia aciculifera]|nr:hypothetical protein GGH93_002793 [Coemansia aciculifera]
MAPLVDEIRVKTVGNDNRPKLHIQHFGDLTSRLYQLACRIGYEYALTTVDYMRLQLDMICNLSHVRYASESYVDHTQQFLQLVRKNALTFQSLVLDCKHDIDMLGLVQDADDNDVAYPCLLTLKLWARGNAATLEQLDLWLDRLSMSMLRKCKVFKPGSHLKLKMAKLWHADSFGLELFASPAEALQFMYSIGSGAAVREYAHYRNRQDQIYKPSSFGDYACIQVLTLPTLRSELWDVITLIRSLPLLSDLCTSLPSLGAMPDGVTMDGLPEHIRSNYAPMGRRFRCWHLDKGYDHNYGELATCVLLLALACPNFDYAAFSCRNRKQFMNAMQVKIAKPEFGQDAPRLRTGWLSAVSKAFAFTSRHRHSPLQALLPLRHLSSHSPAGPSPDIQRAIVEEVRIFQQQDKSIPWYRLGAKYCLSIDVLQTIYDQAEVDAQKRQQQSELVTRSVERHFDHAHGQCNWEAVASEMDIPLIECLDLFDASNATIQPRSLIEAYGGWSDTDMARLNRFIAANYTDGSTIDWRLAGAYMNVDSLECQRVGLGTFRGPINEVGYRRICEFRDSGLKWKDVHQHFLQYPNFIQLQSRFMWAKAKLEGRTAARPSTKLTDTERERMKGLINRYVQSTTRSELVDIIQRELPNRPLSDIRLLSKQYVNELKTGHIRAGQMTQLRELVSEYGEDWDRIGETLGVLPSRARHNWLESGGYAGDHSAWSLDEMRQLQRLIDSGVKPQEAAKLLGMKSNRSCRAKTSNAKLSASKRRANDSLSGTFWAATDDETLLKMIDGSTMSTAAKWEQVSVALGRSVLACKHRFTVVNRDRRQVTDDRESIVTSEVQRQFESSGAADWPQVSQATGLGLRECLELSQYDVGKARWHYDPDSFSQSMVDCMTDFIKEYYPAPVPVKYRAVSNYMWVAMEDCIRIHDILQGKFTWTEAGYKRAIALRAQGLTFKEVARHFSPTLTANNVVSALKRYSSPKSVRESISADELKEISKLVDEYAGKYPVVEIVAKICTMLNPGHRSDHYWLIIPRIVAHPHYQAKLRDIDYNDLANRIAMGRTTAKLAAKELDLPRYALVSRLKGLNSKLFSPKWTEEEIRKLVDYMQTCDSKPDFVYFSKILGTKSPKQCNPKVSELRRKGVLPGMPKV